MMLFFGQCVQICPDGSYPNGKVCSVCPMKCQKCRYENETVQCTMCSSNKFMIVTQPGECIEQCPSSWYADLATYQCYQCQTPCERCSSATSCVTCVVGYLVFNRECVKGNQCPNGSYLLYN
jgi:proprotein convertase subtilisin/kexin type 5